MIANIGFIIVFNIVCVLLVLVFTLRMMRSASVYNWNPGKSDLQYTQKMKILSSLVAIAGIGIIASLVNAFLG